MFALKDVSENEDTGTKGLGVEGIEVRTGEDGERRRGQKERKMRYI